MPIYQIGDKQPSIDETCFVAELATVIGEVTLGRESSVWPSAVIRGDDERISIGDQTNIQDGAVLHADPDCPLEIGSRVTVGHQAMLHGCRVGDGTLIGMQAVVLNRAVIGQGCLVGAGAVVLEGTQFDDGSLIVGAPARVARQLTDDELNSLFSAADSYVRRGQLYRDQLVRLVTPESP